MLLSRLHVIVCCLCVVFSCYVRCGCACGGETGAHHHHHTHIYIYILPPVSARWLLLAGSHGSHGSAYTVRPHPTPIGNAIYITYQNTEANPNSPPLPRGVATAGRSGGPGLRLRRKLRSREVGSVDPPSRGLFTEGEARSARPNLSDGSVVSSI